MSYVNKHRCIYIGRFIHRDPASSSTLTVYTSLHDSRRSDVLSTHNTPTHPSHTHTQQSPQLHIQDHCSLPTLTHEESNSKLWMVCLGVVATNSSMHSMAVSCSSPPVKQLGVVRQVKSLISGTSSSAKIATLQHS